MLLRVIRNSDSKTGVAFPPPDPTDINTALLYSQFSVVYGINLIIGLDPLIVFDDNSRTVETAAAFPINYTVVGAPILGPTPDVTAISSALGRALSTPFMPSADRLTIGTYSFRIASTLNVSGGARGRIELRMDKLVSPATHPTTVAARVAGGITGTVVVGVALTDAEEATITIAIPPGYTCEAVPVNEVGTPTYTLTAATEITL